MKSKINIVKPAYLISNKTAAIILLGLVLLLGISIYTTEYFSKKEQERYETQKPLVTQSLDSFLLIQIQIWKYDSINTTDSLMGIYSYLPPIDSITQVNTLNIEEVTKEIESENLEQLEERKHSLLKQLDSLNRNMEVSTSQINEFERIHDSVSPLYTLKFRLFAKAQVDSLSSQTQLLSESHISRLEKNQIVIQFLFYFIKFSYLVVFILFPVRWVLFHLWQKKQS